MTPTALCSSSARAGKMTTYMINDHLSIYSNSLWKLNGLPDCFISKIPRQPPWCNQKGILLNQIQWTGENRSHIQHDLFSSVSFLKKMSSFKEKMWVFFIFVSLILGNCTYMYEIDLNRFNCLQQRFLEVLIKLLNRNIDISSLLFVKLAFWHNKKHDWVSVLRVQALLDSC